MLRLSGNVLATDVKNAVKLPNILKGLEQLVLREFSFPACAGRRVRLLYTRVLPNMACV